MLQMIRDDYTIRDPDDDKFVECAVVSGASAIVSGDRHLLSLQEYQGIRVFSAAAYLARFEQTGEPTWVTRSTRPHQLLSTFLAEHKQLVSFV